MGQEQWLMPVTPALWEAAVGESPKVTSSRPAWPTWWNPISTKNTKISWAWWQVPVIPATQEDEAGESLEPGRQRLKWAEISPLYSSLGDRARFHLKKKERKYMSPNTDFSDWLPYWKALVKNQLFYSITIIEDKMSHFHSLCRGFQRWRDFI